MCFDCMAKLLPENWRENMTFEKHKEQKVNIDDLVESSVRLELIV